MRVIGTGSYVPDAVVTNDHLHQRFGFDSDWIVKRTGILERRHAAPHQATSDLCVEAANDLFAKTGLTAKDCDLLVLGTFTPDMSFPSTACLVQDRIGLIGPAIEVEAACAGFMYALITAAAYVKAGLSDRALVIGGDTNSRVLNPDDIKTYPLFGDGAGAVFVEPGEPVYEGQVVAENARDNDMTVNPTTAKQLTNMRTTSRDDNIILKPARRMTLEQALEYIEEDELVEATPQSIRLRKALLSENAPARVRALQRLETLPDAETPQIPRLVAQQLQVETNSTAQLAAIRVLEKRGMFIRSLAMPGR